MWETKLSWHDVIADEFELGTRNEETIWQLENALSINDGIEKELESISEVFKADNKLFTYVVNKFCVLFFDYRWDNKLLRIVDWLFVDIYNFKRFYLETKKNPNNDRYILLQNNSKQQLRQYFINCIIANRWHQLLRNSQEFEKLKFKIWEFIQYLEQYFDKQ